MSKSTGWCFQFHQTAGLDVGSLCIAGCRFGLVNLVPLYRVLGHWDMHTSMSLAFLVSVSFVGVQCKLERAYASTRA